MDRLTYLENDNVILEWAMQTWAERYEDLIDRLEDLSAEYPELYHVLRNNFPEMRFREVEPTLTVVE